MTPRSPLTSTEDAADRLDSLRLVDASWFLDGTDARVAWRAERLPGAAFFDIDALSDPESPLPHMLPSPEAFGRAVGELGVGHTDPIVVYDRQGLFSAARAWWMFKAAGARDVRVLDGGLPKWRTEGRPLESGDPAAPRPARFDARRDPAIVADLSIVRAALASGDPVIDARPASRFLGEAPEPRQGLRSGHMPGALNLPFSNLLNPDGTMKRGAALERAFTDAGVDLKRRTVTTCGSGVTAAILSLGLAELGLTSWLYDGSWAEWGADPTLPVVTGAG